jgi:hypothetical protein
MAKKMRKANSFYLLTSPSGKEGIFHQFGSTRVGAICVQNCLAEKYDGSEVLAKQGIYLVKRPGKHTAISMMAATVGYFETPGGLYKVERITTMDPRYMTCPIIQEYSTFFGNANVKSVKADEAWRPEEYKKLREDSKKLDIVMALLGYVPAQSIKKAAKR